MTDTNLSRDDYDKIRQKCLEKNAEIFPSYKKIQDAKECYPPKESVTITDSVAKVSLQSLLDHTARRICQSSQDVLLA